MTEQTLLQLLAAVVARQLDDLDHQWNDDQRHSIAASVAQCALDALVLLVRQTVTEFGVVTIGELGRISKNERGWKFEPAASLLTAASLGRERDSALRELAHQTLFYLRHGLELAEDLREDVGIVTEQSPTPEEKLLKAIFGEKADEAPISTHLAGLSARLRKVSQRLSQRDVAEPEPVHDVVTVGEIEAYNVEEEPK